MNKLPKISGAEWEVMTRLWQDSPLTALEIVEKLPAKNNWNHRTVRTLIARLVKKGAVGYTMEGNKYLYSPKVQREECVRVESQSFLDRVFGGTAQPLLAYLVENTDLSREEIEGLKKLLARKEKK